MADSIDARGLGTKDASVTSVSRYSGAASGVNPSRTASDCYNMRHKMRGRAVIINNKKFNPTKLGDRTGTDVDAASMNDLLRELGFQKTCIAKYDDQTAKNMKDCLIEESRAIDKDSDCFICVILSHGEDGSVWGTDKIITIEELIRPLKGNNCPALAGKPKIFFIQACRGKQVDIGVGMTVSDSAVAGDEKEEFNDVRRIPVEADFLLAYSVTPGFYAWRNEVNGSWFIQAVCDVIKNNWREMDLLTMMTRVNRQVAYDFESKTKREDMNKKKQMPCITSMLTKDVYF
jgi:caspase 7